MSEAVDSLGEVVGTIGFGGGCFLLCAFGRRGRESVDRVLDDLLDVDVDVDIAC